MGSISKIDGVSATGVDCSEAVFACEWVSQLKRRLIWLNSMAISLMRVATTTEYDHPAVNAVQQVGQTLTENIFCYIFSAMC
jgi:hypothetical protein